MAKIQANHIPYRGAAPALTDLIAGRIQYTFDGVATSLGYAQAGTIRILGCRRPEALAGHPGHADSRRKRRCRASIPWSGSGLFAPAKTPKSVVALINRKANAVLAMPSVKESFAKLGIEGVGGTPGGARRPGPDRDAKSGRTSCARQNIRFEQ